MNKMLMTISKCMDCKRLLYWASWKINKLETWGYSAVGLVMRIWLFMVFWQSGMTKIATDTFAGFIPYFTVSDTTYMLFEYEYAVPFLPVSVAAWGATLMEIVGAALLLAGLGTRVFAFGFIIMTGVIHIVDLNMAGEGFSWAGLWRHDHMLWILLLATLLTAGPGRLSLDHLIRRRVL